MRLQARKILLEQSYDRKSIVPSAVLHILLAQTYCFQSDGSKSNCRVEFRREAASHGWSNAHQERDSATSWLIESHSIYLLYVEATIDIRQSTDWHLNLWVMKVARGGVVQKFNDRTARTIFN